MSSKGKIYKSDELVSCYKCNDKYHPTYGGKSIRNSCRLHHFDTNRFCIDCGIEFGKSNANCYHLPKKNIFSFKIS